MNTEVSPMHPESFVATLLEKKFSEGSMWLDTILNDDMVMWGWRRNFRQQVEDFILSKQAHSLIVNAS